MADNDFTQLAKEQISRSTPAGLVGLLRFTLNFERELLEDVDAAASVGLAAFPDLNEAPNAVRLFSMIGRLLQDTSNRVFIDLVLEELAARLGPVEAVQ